MEESLSSDKLYLCEKELPEFSQTLQVSMVASVNGSTSVAEHGSVEEPNRPELVLLVLNAPDPPSLLKELAGSIRETIFFYGNKPLLLFKRLFSAFLSFFPVLQWGRNYNVKSFRSDLMAGLTIASLGIPQSIGYASLAKLDPQYGLYTSIVPPLIYAVMGSSRELAIGPVAVISLLLSSMTLKLANPSVDPIAYRKLIFTATFFTGVFQAAFGFLRLGILVDFLPHSTIVGFMGGAATVIGFQQLKGLLGISHFTNKTDVVSVIKAVWIAVRQDWHPGNFILGCSFLIFILVTKFIAGRKRKLFWLPALAPLVSVILSTLLVFATRADRHGIKTIQYIKGGINPSSLKQLQFTGNYVGESAKIGFICAIIALTEAVAVGRSFASIRGYRLDGNKEMVAMGIMNVAGSLSSCYVATGSFSRSAVNFSAGCRTAVSNVVMAITVLISLQLLTKLFYYTPTAILASIILSALPGLIDLREARKIWNVDKMDFLACVGAFIGVLFGSVEIGLVVAVTISFVRIILSSIRPRIQILGRIRGTDIFCNIRQYPMSARMSSLLITRIDSPFLCFMNANFIRDRITKWVTEGQDVCQDVQVESGKERIQSVVVDMSNVLNIDTSGIAMLEEINKKLDSLGIQLAIASPGWQVIHKMKLAKLVDIIGGRWIFLTVDEAVEACIACKKENGIGC